MDLIKEQAAIESRRVADLETSIQKAELKGKWNKWSSSYKKSLGKIEWCKRRQEDIIKIVAWDYRTKWLRCQGIEKVFKMDWDLQLERIQSELQQIEENTELSLPTHEFQIMDKTVTRMIANAQKLSFTLHDGS